MKMNRRKKLKQSGSGQLFIFRARSQYAVAELRHKDGEICAIVQNFEEHRLREKDYRLDIEFLDGEKGYAIGGVNLDKFDVTPSSVTDDHHNWRLIDIAD